MSTKKKHISYLIMPSNPHDILYPLSVPNTYLLIKSKEEEKKKIRRWTNKDKTIETK